MAPLPVGISESPPFFGLPILMSNLSLSVESRVCTVDCFVELLSVLSLAGCLWLNDEVEMSFVGKSVSK